MALAGVTCYAVEQHRSLNVERHDRAAAEEIRRTRLASEERSLTSLQTQNDALAERLGSLSRQ
jgi:hypothetical protein